MSFASMMRAGSVYPLTDLVCASFLWNAGMHCYMHGTLHGVPWVAPWATRPASAHHPGEEGEYHGGEA